MDKTRLDILGEIFNNSISTMDSISFLEDFAKKNNTTYLELMDNTGEYVDRGFVTKKSQVRLTPEFWQAYSTATGESVLGYEDIECFRYLDPLAVERIIK